MALAKWPAGSPDRLDYTYTFKFQCRNCVTYKGSTTCEAPYDQTEQRSKFYPAAGNLGTPDLAVVEQTGPTAQAQFVEGVRQFRSIINGLKDNLDDDRHIYGTTDADPGGTFNPGINGGSEGADAAGGEVFINHAEPYDAAEPSGLAALQYFLLQVKDFYDQLQNVLGVQPAVDGRLPNPLQVIGDPIRGGVHQMDGVYEWQDTQGNHSVTVEIGPFIIPTTRNYKTGNWLLGKSCIEMLNYCDNTPGCMHHRPDGTAFAGPDRTWVRVTRRDPTNKQVGFWRWNPFGGTIRKTARAAYNRLYVGICGTSGGDCP